MSGARFCKRVTFLKLVCSNEMLHNSFVVHFMGGVTGKENNVHSLLYNICEAEMHLWSSFINIINLSQVVGLVTSYMKGHLSVQAPDYDTNG